MVLIDVFQARKFSLTHFNLKSTKLGCNPGIQAPVGLVYTGCWQYNASLAKIVSS